MSGRIHRDRIPTRAYITLPSEVRAAIIGVKNNLGGQIMETYYTEEHYAKGSLIRIV